MKKIKLIMLSAVFFLLTGCTVSKNGVTFYSNGQNDNSIRETTWDWSLIILILFILVFTIVYNFFIMKKQKTGNTKNVWCKTTAFLTGVSNTYMDSTRNNGAFMAPVPEKEYEIKYYADGKQYLKYIKESELHHGTEGEITIEYLKKRPSSFRVI